MVIKVIILCSWIACTIGFSPLKLTRNSNIWMLEAKAGKTSKKAGDTGGSGFGKAKLVNLANVEKNKIDTDDYIAYPPLEEQVRCTLLPSSHQASEVAQDLTVEHYDRISQIYGLKDFNFPKGWFDDEMDDAKQSFSVNDLISDGETSDQASVNDLLGSNSKVIPSSLEEYLDIEKLPPFNKFRVLHVDPMVLCVDDFFSDQECDEYIALCENPKKRTLNNDMPMMSGSKTVGKDSLAKAQRTSTTWFHHYKGAPALMAKASRLLGLRNIDRWEEPQTVRYQKTEKFTWHLDALAPSETLQQSGGQRVATLLVYLNNIADDDGGATIFRDLGKEGDYLRVQPKKGSALVFFPAAGGISGAPFDVRTLHAGEAMSKDADASKWIAQLWLRENSLYSPTAPPGNTHKAAKEEINKYCGSF